MAKQLLASMQTEVIGEHGTDCHTKKTIDVKITKKYISEFSYRYIIENGKYVCLTPDIMGRYMNTIVHLRTPMYCTNDEICNICAGEMNYRLGTLKIGLQTSKVANTLLKLGMKKFHISSLKSVIIDPDDMLV